MNPYTIEELLRVLKEARILGLERIEIPPFSFVFAQDLAPKIGVPNPSSINHSDGVFPVLKSRPKNNPQNNSQGVESCADCGSNDMRPSAFGPGNYCHDCHLDRKEKQWKKKKTW